MNVLMGLVIGLSVACRAAGPVEIVARRCGPCHDWATRSAGLDARRGDVARRLAAGDTHIVGRLDGGELVLLQRSVAAQPSSTQPAVGPSRGAEPPSRWMEYRQPIDTTTAGVGPFTPCELGCDDPLPTYERPRCRACEQPASLSGARARALRDIGINCGRCHGWATRPHLIVREHARIVPRILSGHGLRHLSVERRQGLLTAFLPRFVTPHVPRRDGHGVEP